MLSGKNKTTFKSGGLVVHKRRNFLMKQSIVYIALVVRDYDEAIDL
jgi:hypothetical protein